MTIKAVRAESSQLASSSSASMRSPAIASPFAPSAMSAGSAQDEESSSAASWALTAYRRMYQQEPVGMDGPRRGVDETEGEELGIREIRKKRLAEPSTRDAANFGPHSNTPASHAGVCTSASGVGVDCLSTSASNVGVDTSASGVGVEIERAGTSTDQAFFTDLGALADTLVAAKRGIMMEEHGAFNPPEDDPDDLHDEVDQISEHTTGKNINIRARGIVKCKAAAEDTAKKALAVRRTHRW